MPNLNPETEKQRALRLTNLYTENGLNQAAVARKEGVTRAAINNRIKRGFVQKTLQETFKKVGITTRYKARKFKQLLESKKVQDCDVFVKDENGKLRVNKNSNDFIEVEDNNTQLGALRLLCQVEGDIKTNGNNKGVTIINIVNAYRERDKSISGPLRDEERSTEPS